MHRGEFDDEGLNRILQLFEFRLWQIVTFYDYCAEPMCVDGARSDQAGIKVERSKAYASLSPRQ